MGQTITLGATKSQITKVIRILITLTTKIVVMKERIEQVKTLKQRFRIT